jgi:uncharacterized protein
MNSSGYKSVIGMVHLRALPGAPGYDGNLARVRDDAVRDAERLASGGVDSIMIENFGDVPFFKTGVAASTIASLAVIAADVKKASGLPIGINCLRNDGCAAVSIACAVGAAFVRVNVLTCARVTDQGVIEGIAAELLRLRSHLRADAVQIMADVDVKHSAPLAVRPLEEEVADTVERGGADALIVSGSGTGKPTDPQKCQRVKRVADYLPVYVGSGVTLDTVGEFMASADGFIVGTHFKVDGLVDQPVDVARVKAFVGRVRNGG